mmetsp:Transcript_5011/g.16565  ORF Transcript_5011/g.16565 Transcript_5011/m.16565 type:complete len:104 (+) Transcript_5011:575-886(+)|eukprot:scaffold11534_cov84-Isochrysis_galbana.AAC.1
MHIHSKRRHSFTADEDVRSEKTTISRSFTADENIRSFTADDDIRSFTANDDIRSFTADDETQSQPLHAVLVGGGASKGGRGGGGRGGGWAFSRSNQMLRVVPD